MIDLSQYEDAATLNRWFLNNFPVGRIDLQIAEINLDKGIVIFKGSVYRDSNDLNPAVSNYAKGERDDYPAHMRKWYLEDTATSCIARCLTLLKGSNKTAPKESMERATSWSVEPKVALDKELLTGTTAVSQSKDLSYGLPGSRSAAVADVLRASFAEQGQAEGHSSLPQQYCEDGTMMLFKTGINKTTGKPYQGYVCSCGKPQGQQCAAKWASQSQNGNWYFKESVSG